MNGNIIARCINLTSWLKCFIWQIFGTSEMRDIRTNMVFYQRPLNTFHCFPSDLRNKYLHSLRYNHFYVHSWSKHKQYCLFTPNKLLLMKYPILMKQYQFSSHYITLLVIICSQVSLFCSLYDSLNWFFISSSNVLCFTLQNIRRVFDFLSYICYKCCNI